MTIPTLSRRELLVAGAAGAALLVLPRAGRAASESELSPAAVALRDALEKSPLIYVCPLKKDGKEGTCHAEAWFVRDGADAIIVTAQDRWKARAVSGGLDRARLWVGDFGVWKDAGGKFKDAPTFDAKAAFVKDPATQARILEAYGKKYPAEWGKWGPRFHDGLADGSRVMIRYTPTA